MIFSYVEDVNKNGEKPGDAQIGRQLMDIVTASSNNMQPEKLDTLVKNTLRVSFQPKIFKKREMKSCVIFVRDFENFEYLDQNSFF